MLSLQRRSYCISFISSEIGLQRLLLLDFWPPYPIKIAMKPYPKNYISSNLRKYNNKSGSAKEHLIQFSDDLGIHKFDHELWLKEFSKSLIEHAYSWYANLAPNSIKT